MATRVKVKKPGNETLDYQEVKTVYSDAEASALVKNGWNFICVGISHIDGNGFNAKPTFIMAKENPKR